MAYAEATKVTAKDLVVTHPICLGTVLNFSVFQHEVLQESDEAWKMAPVIVIPQEGMSERIVEQIVDVPVSRTQKQINEVFNVILPERLSEGIVELIQAAPMPQIKEKKTHPSSAAESYALQQGLPVCRTVHIREPSVRAPPRLKIA